MPAFPSPSPPAPPFPGAPSSSFFYSAFSSSSSSSASPSSFSLIGVWDNGGDEKEHDDDRALDEEKDDEREHGDDHGEDDVHQSVDDNKEEKEEEEEEELQQLIHRNEDENPDDAHEDDDRHDDVQARHFTSFSSSLFSSSSSSTFVSPSESSLPFGFLHYPHLLRRLVHQWHDSVILFLRALHWRNIQLRRDTWTKWGRLGEKEVEERIDGKKRTARSEDDVLHPPLTLSCCFVVLVVFYSSSFLRFQFLFCIFSSYSCISLFVCASTMEELQRHQEAKKRTT